MAETKKPLILIADNDAKLREILRMKLEDIGFEVQEAENGKEAIAAAKKRLPALIIMDVQMPITSGTEAVMQIKQDPVLQNIPVLFLSAFGKEDMDQAVQESSGIDYLKKTSGLSEIVAKITELTQKLDTTPPFIKRDVNTKNIAVASMAMATKKSEPPPQPEKAKADSDAKATPPPADKKEKPQKPALSESEHIQQTAATKQRIEQTAQKPEAEISIIQLVDDMMTYAFFVRASDIHLEPFEDHFIARLRIDGILQDVFTFAKSLQPGVVTRIKVLGGMRTDEHQAAQDGRFRMSIAKPETQFDVRVSIVPTYYGENAVLRLLAEQTAINSLEDLALSDENRAKIRNAAQTPYGMILATGPTGSGKTTTLYTILKELNTREVQIITLEDPIEYSLDGVDQIQVNQRTGLTFATGLRSILRQDPNIIMVGEIRDEETTSIAVNAALTGHKLLATLHTNDAATTLPRLLDMGAEPFLVASTINIAIGQRLVRTICPHCKTPRRITDAEYEALKEQIDESVLGNQHDFFIGKGCDACNQSGYLGRKGIYEILEMNDLIREAIMRRADAGELKRLAVKSGMITLLEDGFVKAKDGQTTIEEVLRVIHE